LIEKLHWEHELLGIYISGHPLDAYKTVASKAGTNISEILREPPKGLLVILPVLITEVRTILSKKGEKMAFIKVSDKTGDIEAVVFPKLFKDHAERIVAGTCILIKAKITNRNGEFSLAIENLKSL
jgi:DNA polymerase III subunit alpha